MSNYTNDVLGSRLRADCDKKHHHCGLTTEAWTLAKMQKNGSNVFIWGWKDCWVNHRGRKRLSRAGGHRWQGTASGTAAMWNTQPDIAGIGCSGARGPRVACLAGRGQRQSFFMFFYTTVTKYEWHVMHSPTIPGICRCTLVNPLGKHLKTIIAWQWYRAGGRNGCNITCDNIFIILPPG